MSDEATSVIKRASALGLTIATCESLTGGGVGAALTGVAGASAVYLGGFITYASAQKTAMVGVDVGHIAAHGVINATTAKQMATGALERTGADLAVSTTGVAGPSGQDGHEPGEVWIGLAWREDGNVTTAATRHQCRGDRADVRAGAVHAAIMTLLSHVGAA